MSQRPIMCRISDLPLLSNGLRLMALCTFVVSLNGCAAMRAATEQSSPSPAPLQKEMQRNAFAPPLQKDIERNLFTIPKGDDVIGRLATVKLEKGDTLPDLARHFSLGITALTAANPEVDLWVPETGKHVILPLSFILPDAPRKGIVINLAAMRLFRFKGNGKALAVSTYPVGVGTSEKPTPTGQMHVERKATRPTWHVPASIAEAHKKKGVPLPAKVPPGPLNPLGECALYLSKASYLIHGTNKPASIGLQATNGCIRLYPEDVKTLYNDTPVDTPVVIVDQPYLIGQRDGVLYLEAHAPLEGSDSAELEKIINARLRSIEKKWARTLDWRKVKEVQTAATGIPVPILEMAPVPGKEARKTVEVEHPGKMYGRTELPELRLDAWYVLAASVRDEVDALRLAAIINHQGPPIPARVIPKSDSFWVVAGPFDDISEAKDATKRLKIDLGLDGVLGPPGPPGKKT